MESKNLSPAEKGQKDFALDAGIAYPIIKINSYVLSFDEIKELYIDINGFIPTIYLDIESGTNSLTGTNMPKDGDIVSVFLRSKQEGIKPLRADFLIMKISVNEYSNQKAVKRRYSRYLIQGEMYIPKMTSQVDQFAFCGTSKEAVEDFCQRYKLGFSFTDEENTDDKQIWICYSNTPEEYIKSVVEHAWKDETSFFDCWIDQYYNFNFINVNDILGRKLEDDGQIDFGSMANTFATSWYDGESMLNKDSSFSPKLFTNAAKLENTVWYITSWKPFNKSSQITLNEGTKIEPSFFLANQYLFDSSSQQDTSVLCEPTYNPDKLKTHIILRGRTGLTTDGTKQANNGEFVDLYKRTPWKGIQYVMSDSDKESQEANNMKWSGNTHKNYYRAESHNRINLKELDKMTVEIKVDGLNFNILRGEKIPIIIFDQNRLSAAKNSTDTAFENSKYDMSVMFMYSGWFMIDSIRYEYNQAPKPKERTDIEHKFLTNYSTIITLTRREWVTPEPVSAIKTN